MYHFNYKLVYKTFIISIIVSFFLCTSCEKKKLHFSDAVFEVIDMNDTPTILVDGSPYTGVLWSNDERTMSIEVRNGDIETFTLYHMNGKIANIQYGSNKNGSNFDEEGNSLEEWELDNKYPYLRDATERIMEREIIPNIVQKNRKISTN